MSTFFFCLALSDICNIFKSQCQHKITSVLHNILHDGFFFPLLWASIPLYETFPEYTVFSVLSTSAPATEKLGRVGMSQGVSWQQKWPRTRLTSKHKLLGLWGCGRFSRSVFFKDNIWQHPCLEEFLPCSYQISCSHEQKNGSRVSVKRLKLQIMESQLIHNKCKLGYMG